MTKFIFIIGGVLSSVGKGIVTSSIGKMLQTRGFKVTAIKIDPVSYTHLTLPTTERV